MTICKRCLFTSNIPGISFDEAGVCNYCHSYDEMDKEYPVSDKIFKDMINKISLDGRNKKYDCVVGFSGGCDSSYLLWKLVENGLHPLAVHWDNNWNTKTARENMKKVAKGLDVDVEYYHISKMEYDDLCHAFLLGGTPDMDIPNDIAIATVLYVFAEKHDVKYIMNGHSFRTEGFTPLGWTYMDGKYIESVHKKYGKVPLKQYPNLLVENWLRWLKQEIKRVRPLYHLDYNKQKAQEGMNKKFGWEWYGGHHAENRYTKFVSNYLWTVKFGIDLRYVEYSALVRSGQIKREDAWKKVHCPLGIEPEIVEEVKHRLKISGDEFQHILDMPVVSYKKYETYQRYFHKNKKTFEQMYQDGLIPFTFLKKYCLGDDDGTRNRKN